MNRKNNDLIIGSMSAGKSNWFPPVFWAYHCECGANYQGIYDKFKYPSNKKTLPLKNCPNCRKSIVQVNWLDYGNEKIDDKNSKQ